MQLIHKKDCVSKVNNRGFSLIEIIVVVLLIGIITLIALRSPFSSNANLIAETDLLRSHMRYAQSLAMASNADSWGIAITAGSYSLRKNGATATVTLPGLGFATHAFSAGIRVTQGSGVILFDEWGSPGNTTINITLSDGTHTSTITLTAETGYQS